jgi:hypothetical protein
MVERLVARLAVLIDQPAMALREGAAPAILTGQADLIAFQQQGAKGQRLGGGPVDAAPGLDRLALGVKLTGG